MGEELSTKAAVRNEAARLLQQVRDGSGQIQRALGDLRGDPALKSQLLAMLSQASDVASQIAGSSKGSLANLELLAMSAFSGIPDTSALVTEVSGMEAARIDKYSNLAATSAAAREEVASLSEDVFNKRIFDPYLHFTSNEDKQSFLAREKETQAYIDAQLKRNTPEGDLNASGGMQRYMLDAHTHGAGDSPDFMPRWNALAEKSKEQRAAMKAKGLSTAEYDSNLTKDVEAFLKTKGLSDTDIAARMKSSDNPLDIVKPFLGKDNASANLVAQTDQIERVEQAEYTAAASLPRVMASNDAAKADASLAINPDAMNAKLEAAGLRMPNATPGKTDNAPPAHGLTVAKPASALAVG